MNAVINVSYEVEYVSVSVDSVVEVVDVEVVDIVVSVDEVVELDEGRSELEVDDVVIGVVVVEFATTVYSQGE